MADVFVSYSRQDSVFVSRLAEAVTSSGKEVWIDTSGIEDTEVFPLAIRSAIEASDAFLFVISPASVVSRYCEQEVEYAVSLNKRLVPVLLGRVPDEELPDAIRVRTWIPFDAGSDFEASLVRVMASLDADLDYRKSHTRWLTKAIEWDNEGRDSSLLLRGTELRAAEEWLANTTPQSDPAPTTLQRECVLASRQAAGRRSRMLVAGSLGVSLLAVGLLVFALISRSQAVHQQTLTSAEALAVESENDLAVDPEASVILAMRSVDKHATGETMLALREALDASALRASLPSVDPVECNAPGPSVAFRPGSDQVAENTCKGGVIIADATTGKVIRRISADTDVASIAYSPSGQLIALGTFDGVAILDANTGRREKFFVGPSGTVVFSRSGALVGATSFGLYGAGGGSTMIFNLATGAGTSLPITGLPGSSNSTGSTSLAFTPDNRYAIAGTAGGQYELVFDASSGRYIKSLHAGPLGLDNYPSYVATTAAASLLAVAVNTDSGDNEVEIWNTKTWKMEFVLTSASGVQYSQLAFSPDGTRLAVSASDGTVAIWSIATRQRLVSFPGQRAINSLAFSPDGTEIATADDGGTVRIWRASGPELADLYPGGTIDSLALSSSSVVVASVEGGRVVVASWTTAGAPISAFTIPGSSAYDVVSVSPDGQHVADFAYIPSSTGLAQSGQVQVFNTRTGSLSGTYPVAGSEALAWSRDGRYLAAASQGLEVVDLATGTEEAFVVAGAEQCGSDGAPAFSADDSLVAWATRCGSVGVFRLSGAPVSSFSVAGQPSGLAFNSSGSSLAVSNWDGAVDVFDPRTGTEVLSLPTAPSSVTAVAFSNDDRYIVTTLDNQSVEVFGAASGELDRIDLDPSRLLAGPAFDAGGSDFATADASGTVKIWSECPAYGDAPMLERLARSQVVTELTPMEQAAEK